MMETLQREGSLTQVEIAGVTGLSAASISTLVRELNDEGAVRLEPSIRNGRRATLVSLPGQRGMLAGIAIGDRDLRVAVVASPAGDVLERTRLPLPFQHEPDETLARAARLVADLHTEIGRPVSDLRAVGVAMQAPVDSVSGQVGSESVMPRWSGVMLTEALQALLRVPVQLDNDANMSALGELRAGVLAGVANGCYLRASHGVSAGLVIGGEVFSGVSGTAGEIGHVTLDENGAICACGNRGCLDTLVGSRALVESVRGSHGDLRFTDLVTLAGRGDVGCRRVLADAGMHLGVAVAGLINLLNPEVIVLGGDLLMAQEWVLGPMQDSIERRALPSAAASVELRPSALGADADLRGCFVAAAQISSFHEPDSAHRAT
nr:ROK family transcriptional regulator [Ornithinimicrobium pratense]